MEDISEDTIDAMIERQDADLERWLGRLVLLAQTAKGRGTIQSLLGDLNNLIESMTDEAQRHMGAAPSPAPGHAGRAGGTLNVRKQLGPQGVDRETAQAAVLNEFTRFVLAAEDEHDSPEEIGQRKLVVALSLWPELAGRVSRWNEDAPA